MQCQSQLSQQSLDPIHTALRIREVLWRRNQPWFFNKNPIETEEEKIEPFSDIENMTIERIWQNYKASYKASKGDPQHRLVALGLWSVDLKLRIKFLTDDPNNAEMHRLILRGSSHHYQRLRIQNQRFVVGSEYDSKGEWNWLGQTWFSLNKNKYPSLNQIEVGLIAETMVQIHIVAGNVLKKNQLIATIKNIKQTWQDLFEEASTNETERYKPLKCGRSEEPLGLSDPYHPMTIVILFIYQMQSWCFKELNKACRYKHADKIKTLGPYALALSRVIACAQMHRSDVEKYDCWKDQDLWRGVGMTMAQIQQFIDMVGSNEEINLSGFSSCSLDKRLALSFAWENTNTGHQKVLLHFEWNAVSQNYFLDGGAYDHEQEVLLCDGVSVKVKSVSRQNENQPYTLITLQKGQRKIRDLDKQLDQVRLTEEEEKESEIQMKIAAHVEEHKTKLNKLLQEKLDSEHDLRAKAEQMEKDLNKQWDAKLREAVETVKERQQVEAQKKLDQVQQDCCNDTKLLKDQIAVLNDQVAEAQKLIQTNDFTIQSKDSEISIQKGNIMNLEKEIEMLRLQVANGDSNAAELQKLLGEFQQKLEDSMRKCDGMQQTIQLNEEDYQDKCLRLNTEIDRLNNVLKATNGNMQEQIQKLNEQIKKLEQEILELKSNNERLENEQQEYIVQKRSRTFDDQIIIEIDKYRKQFFIDTKLLELKDFNQVKARQDKNERKKSLKSKKENIKEFNDEIINTLFGIILRHERITDYAVNIKEFIPEMEISQRFLISYLMQCSDFGLKSRLNYYLVQNNSVPLIMNCQRKCSSLNFNLIYNHELIFIMEQTEGYGILSMGVGSKAILPCGKSDICNYIAVPGSMSAQQVFETHDDNVFSNGQVDVFFDKCYQRRTNKVFMDGQGKLQDQALKSVLTLSNIVLIHFMNQDLEDKQSLQELEKAITLTKEMDNTTQIFLIIRDCNTSEELTEHSQYPSGLNKFQKLIDRVFKIRDHGYMKEIEKKEQLSAVVKSIQETVDQNVKDKLKPSFTRERFQNKFGTFDQSEEAANNRMRTEHIFQLSQEFILDVSKNCSEGILNPNGLQSLKIKDEISKKILSLRKDKEINADLKTHREELSKLVPNDLMRKFWAIINHEDAVHVKFEIAKGLALFTHDNTWKLREQKRRVLYVMYQDFVNKKFTDELQELDEQIFTKSISFDYLWRSLIILMMESNKCDYWTKPHNKIQFQRAIQSQMLAGDCFELIDGRTLEMKADILKEILGQIDQKKCIVACVIGPQSTGKSTLMNYCFGTQFLASTCRCTQGIYFTLQKIPPGICKDGSVEYLLILDTEGLNSPERSDNAYDRKIIIFALMCVDFLIINAKGDMQSDMIELLKICTIQYDKLREIQYEKLRELRKYQDYIPQILYTYVQNDNARGHKILEQVVKLRDDVIRASDSCTIEQTATELLGARDDLIKVLGTAYALEEIEPDESNGIIQHNQIMTCLSAFGIQAADVFKLIEKFLNRNHESRFKQIGQWFVDSGQNWDLINKHISKHGVDTLNCSNIDEMKNNFKIKRKLEGLWSDYLDLLDQTNKKQNWDDYYDYFDTIENQIKIDYWQDTSQYANQLLKMHTDKASKEQINLKKQEIIEQNDTRKNEDFDEHIIQKLKNWLKEYEQKNIKISSQDKLEEHLADFRAKMKVVKNDFIILLEGKLQEEGIMPLEHQKEENKSEN